MVLITFLNRNPGLQNNSQLIKDYDLADTRVNFANVAIMVNL